MKYVLKSGALLLFAALSALPAVAQNPAPSPAATQNPAPSPAATPSPCEQAKTEEYMKWRENRQGTPEQQKQAYEAGKAFLAKCTDAADDAYITAVKKWVPKYEEAVVAFEKRNAWTAAVKALNDAQGTKNYAPLFAAGKDLLALTPDDLGVLLALAQAGTLNALAGKDHNPSLVADAITHTKRALGLVEAGKASPDDLKQLSATTKEDAVLALNYRLGVITHATAGDEATKYLLKVAQSNHPLKSDPVTYTSLAKAYTQDYTKLAAEYRQKFPEGQPVPEERKAEYDQYNLRLEQILDRIIDARARAVALITKTDKDSVEFKRSELAQLENLYKQRHEGKADGLNEFVSASATRRLPLPTDPLPTPPPAPAPTPAAPAPSPTPTPTQPPARRG